MYRKFVKLPFVILLFICLSCKQDEIKITTIDELEDAIKEEVDYQGLPSVSYCVVKNDKILYSNAKGYADEDRKIKATDSTRYLIASISKTITAVAFMQLVDQNLVDLDDDINLYLPFSVRNPNYDDEPITFRMLLTHTSSISDRFQDNFDLDCYGKDCSMSLDQYCKNVFLSGGIYNSSKNFTNNEPGFNEDYSNLGFALLGYLVERIANTPFDVYCKNKIFIPLGMKKTEWRLANTPLSELAIPYSPDIPNQNNPHFTFPDYPNGGMRTTVLDLSRFLRMFIQNGTFEGKQILSVGSAKEMKTLQFESESQGLSFYFEYINDMEVFGHSGGEKGATAEMYYDTKTNIGFIVFTNEEDGFVDNIISYLVSYAENQ